MTTFRALRVSKTAAGQSAAIEELSDADLMPGDVTVAVSHSTVNYKDGLAVTGKAPIIRSFPLIPGIDFAGVVTQSGSADFKPGDPVILNGWGVGESHHGGFAGRARVKAEWLTPLPRGLSAHEAMAIGTAGYTAMLCIMALEAHGVTPASGEVLVTGAAGGVGSIAVTVLAKLGFTVVASTGRPAESAFLKELGAAEVIDRAILSTPGKPLGKARWAGAVDSVGSITLANVLAQTLPEGTVAACGLAQGMDLPTSVAPFILRGVTLAGINSVTAAASRRVEAWRRLAQELDRAKLASLTTTVALDGVARVAADIIEGKIRGRTVVQL